MSTGAKTNAGKERISKARFKHGRFTNEAKAHKRYIEAIFAFDTFIHQGQAALMQCAEALDLAAQQSDEEALAKNCKLTLRYFEVEGVLIGEVVESAKAFGIDEVRFPKYSPADLFMQALRAGAEGQGFNRYLELMAQWKATKQREMTRRCQPA